MKSLLTLIIGFISLQLLAQAPPQGINYQAVAYDFNNNTLSWAGWLGRRGRVHFLDSLWVLDETSLG